MKRLVTIGFLLSIIWQGCTYQKTKEPVITNPNYGVYDPTPYEIDLPSNAPPIPASSIPASNPMTTEGVNLGHRLFFDPIMSGDNTKACASCHMIEHGTTDGLTVSEGILGIKGKRNAMPLFNLVYEKEFFWDGRAQSLEEQALMPIQDHIELDETISHLITELKADSAYPRLFFKAFGTTDIKGQYIAMAIAQYLRALISFDSKYDRVQRLQAFFSDAEGRGQIIFNDLSGGDCFHCHEEGTGIFVQHLFETNFENNGLDAASTIYDFPDPGRAKFTGRAQDYGRFKIPSLRNLTLTAPYMHDGRFSTLEAVIDHYSEGLEHSPTTNPGNLQFVDQGGVHLTAQEKSDLLAFLKCLSDSTVLTKPLFQNPF